MRSEHGKEAMHAAYYGGKCGSGESAPSFSFSASAHLFRPSEHQFYLLSLCRQLALDTNTQCERIVALAARCGGFELLGETRRGSTSVAIARENRHTSERESRAREAHMESGTNVHGKRETRREQVTDLDSQLERSGVLSFCVALQLQRLDNTL